MKSRQIVGKTIKRVLQTPYAHNWSGGPASTIKAIEFTDGTTLRFTVLEDEGGGEYGIEPIYPARGIDEGV